MSGEGGDTGARVVQSERAARYREQAKHFQQLASTELQPRARAQLLGLAEEYNQLADMKPRQPSSSSLLMRSWNKYPAGMFHARTLQITDGILKRRHRLVGLRQ